MSPQQTADNPAAEPYPDPSPRPGTALHRLDELRRALQRQLRRKPKEFERTSLEHAALMLLRSEIAARDPDADSTDIVRLANVARRARLDFERITGIDTRKRRNKQRSMADLELEIASHV
jgi:hypothetical protein